MSGLTRSVPLLAPAWGRSRTGLPSQNPPTFPSLVRNSLMIDEFQSLGFVATIPPSPRLFALFARTNDHQGYPQPALEQLRDVVAGAVGGVDPYPHDASGGRVPERLLGRNPAPRRGGALAVAPKAEPSHDRDH